MKDAKTQQMLPAAILVGMLVLSGCSTIVTNHGYAPSDVELQELLVGVDTRDSVIETIGRPSTAGILSQSAYYYVAERRSRWALQAAKPTQRELVAISFDTAGVITNIERFGLEDGAAVPLSRRITETSIRDMGLVQQLLRNFGRIDVGEAIANQ